MSAIKREALLAWYAAHKRDLPWRQTSDPYAIWVSEIMLQQTQVATVLPYYRRWMERFPTAQALAETSEADVLSLWQGLGYYRRCRMLLAGARWVAEHGQPSSAAEWRKVPGVGRYTAAAIASISLSEPAALVDGNVERVFARHSGCDLSGASLHRAAWVWAEQHVPAEKPGDWNQALMELGATVCRPREPLCGSCPIARDCVARQEGLQQMLPVAASRPATVPLKHTACIYVREGRYGLEQIGSGEWWAGMWRFPRTIPTAARLLGVVRHTVTHHRISLAVHLADGALPAEGLTWFSVEELETLPIPSPQRRALKLALRESRVSVEC